MRKREKITPSPPPITGRKQDVFVPPTDPDAGKVPAPEPKYSASELFRSAGDKK